MTIQSHVPHPSALPGDARLKRSASSEDGRISLHDLGPLFTKRPLIIGEDEAEYDDLLSKLTAAVRPTDVIETLWVQDLVDLALETKRLWRLRAGLLMAAANSILVRALMGAKDLHSDEPIGRDYAEGMANDVVNGSKIAFAEVSEILAGDATDLSAIMAEALASRLGDIERFDRLIVSAETRRSRILAEIERHRGGLAHRLRAAPDLTDVTWVETSP